MDLCSKLETEAACFRFDPRQQGDELMRAQPHLLRETAHVGECGRHCLRSRRLARLRQWRQPPQHQSHERQPANPSWRPRRRVGGALVQAFGRNNQAIHLSSSTHSNRSNSRMTRARISDGAPSRCAYNRPTCISLSNRSASTFASAKRSSSRLRSAARAARDRARSSAASCSSISRRRRSGSARATSTFALAARRKGRTMRPSRGPRVD